MPIAAAAALTVAPATEAQQTNTDAVACAALNAGNFSSFSSTVWHPKRWRRGAPKRKTIKAQRRALRCMPGPARLRSARKRWRADKRTYNRHRKRRLEQRRARKRRQAYLSKISPPGAETLAAIRECESGGDYSTNTGNGFYGAYQFSLSTWASVGGSGLPSSASPREQDVRAAKLYRSQGSSPWPVCGV